MTDEVISMVRRYEEIKQEVFEVIEAYKEQKSHFDQLMNSTAEDTQDVRDGMLIIEESAMRFFQAIERLVSESHVDPHEIMQVVTCFRATIGGCSLAFRHLELSRSLTAASLKEKTKAGSSARTAGKEREAERVRDIIERAQRRPNGTIAKPGGVKRLVAARLGKEDIDYRTFRGYVEVIEGISKTDGRPLKK